MRSRTPRLDTSNLREARRVLFVSQFDPKDASSWSGTAHQMWKSLNSLASVETLVVRPPWLVKVVDRLGARLGRRVEFSRARWVLRLYAQQILRKGPFDLVFSPSSVPVAMLPKSVRTAFWTDATFSLLADYYPGDAPLSVGAWRRGTAQEVAALRHSVAIYASEWAAESARSLCPQAHIVVHPFGPNLSAESIARIRKLRTRIASVASSSLSPADRKIVGLWIGVEWRRKGGDVAVAAFRELEARGQSVELILIGLPSEEIPSYVRALPFVSFLGRLNKAVPDQLQTLEQCFARADLLLLPSMAEAAGIVVSEAALCGVTCVVSDVGGLGATVKNLNLGSVVSRGPDAEQRFADAIENEIKGPQRTPVRREVLSYGHMFAELLG